MTRIELQTLHNACHDYGTIISGEFPSLDAVLKANREGRLVARDLNRAGWIKIVGENACNIEFEVD